jgi:hypothetical protein
MCGQGSCCVSYENGCCCGCSCGCYGNYGHHHHRHHESRMGVGAGIESLVPLMDIDEEIRMLEEYKDALTKQLEMVNKRLGRLKS